MFRTALLAALRLLAGCTHGLQPRFQTMSPEEMLDLATHVFIGVVEREALVHMPFFRLSGRADDWRVLQREVRVELTVRGTGLSRCVSVFEVVWMGVRLGDWNSTQNGGRYLFLTRIEGGRHHVVRDWWRSIFPIGSGRPRALPGSGSDSLLERIAMLAWWPQADWEPEMLRRSYAIPMAALSRWRSLKLLRGFLHHPDPLLRAGACAILVSRFTGADECLAALPADEQREAQEFVQLDLTEERERSRRYERLYARMRWRHLLSIEPSVFELDEIRQHTTIADSTLRREFCLEFARRFPHETDHGCGTDRWLPATRITGEGEVPVRK